MISFSAAQYGIWAVMFVKLDVSEKSDLLGAETAFRVTRRSASAPFRSFRLSNQAHIFSQLSRSFSSGQWAAVR